jgi:hypothetical protein
MEKKVPQTFKSGIQQEYVDPQTGEIIRQAVITERVPGYVDVKVPQKHRFDNGSFITVFQEVMRNIAKYGKLTKNEYQLLIWLIGTAGIDNSIEIDLNILASELNLDKGNVSKALKGLVCRNIVLRKDGYRYGNSALPFELKLNYNQINYDLAFNGQVKSYKKVKGLHPIVKYELEDKGGQKMIEFSQEEQTKGKK